MPNKPVLAAAEGVPTHMRDQVAAAFRGLEADLCELTSMARITADLLDAVLSDDRTLDERTGYYLVRVSDHDMRSICFAWNNVASRAIRLEERFYAANTGEVGK